MSTLTPDPHLPLPVLVQHAPGVPKILVGNRLHLAFKRQVPTEQARAYAEKNSMTFFEVSPLCNFNVIESFTELSRIVLMRHGMEKFWRPNRGDDPLGLLLCWPTVGGEGYRVPHHTVHDTWQAITIIYSHSAMIDIF